MVDELRVIEICAGAGGQALGLEAAGFEHELAIELDESAVSTLRHNRPSWKVVQGDVADKAVWDPADYAPHEGSKPIDLFAGGVPCPPFSIAGKQLGAGDERDLFAWAIEQTAILRPRAVLLENVRGLSLPRFAGYRQHVLDRLREFGYVAEWRLLQASDFGVPQLRPRFVLVAMQPEDFAFFRWPEPLHETKTVGQVLAPLMGSAGWEGTEAWARGAESIAPTVVGGSKKHGGADLGPTRAKRAWASIGVDGRGVANEPPAPGSVFEIGPRLTCEMVARIQGWDEGTFKWEFTGKKTSVYRQIGNAFPPPVARAIGTAIGTALHHEGEPKDLDATDAVDPLYRLLRECDDFVSAVKIAETLDLKDNAPELDRRISILSQDFEILKEKRTAGHFYKIGSFRGFTGQEGHARHEYFRTSRSKVS
ncbi:DNA cytosine methyltransferase [Arthrobacter koreensis]|uniref:DNA cytosine methyltransferase n=1 Tax=Arthrobacter koreensis TaxID=199136 RepID=UPI0036DA8AD0